MVIFNDTKKKKQYFHLMRPRKIELPHLGEHLMACVPMEVLDKVFLSVSGSAIGIQDECH